MLHLGSKPLHNFASSPHWNSEQSLSSQQRDTLTRLQWLQGFLSKTPHRLAAVTSSVLTHTPSVASVYNQGAACDLSVWESPALGSHSCSIQQSWKLPATSCSMLMSLIFNLCARLEAWAKYITRCQWTHTSVKHINILKFFSPYEQYTILYVTLNTKMISPKIKAFGFPFTNQEGLEDG